MQGISIDWTVNFGTLLHLFGMLMAGVGLYLKINNRLASLEHKVDTMFGWWQRRINRLEEAE